MSASAGPALHAIASELAEALLRYEEEVATMVEVWPDMDQYRTVSARIEQIRARSSALVDARLQWVELLIAHADLVHLLWRAQYGSDPAAAPAVAAARERHADCVRALRNRCLRAAIRIQRFS